MCAAESCEPDQGPDDRQSQVATFVMFGVYRIFSRGKSELLRFLGEDFDHDELIFKRVAEKWDKVERLAIAVPRTEAEDLVLRGLLVEAPGLVRPVYLNYSDVELVKWTKKSGGAVSTWLSERDSRFEMIRPLVTAGGRADVAELQARIVQTYSPRYCRAVVVRRAGELGVKELVLMRVLHKFAWFGLEINSLLNLDSSKGVTGALLRRYRGKPGPRSAAEKVFGSKHRGRARSQADLVSITLALQADYVENHLSLKETFKNATVRSGLMLNLTQFLYSARILRRRLGLDAERKGRVAGAKHRKAGGRDTTIAKKVGDVYDTDGTPFNRQLVSQFRTEDGKAFNAGPATVIVVFDRFSKKVVGWHVYMGSESWREGYRLALLCAMTSKKRHLEWLGIDRNPWRDDENIRPACIYVDGGAAASTLGAEALARLGIDFIEAPPATPHWKPTVEGGIGLAQAEQSHLKGGFERTNDAVEKEMKRKAKLHADDDAVAFERQLVLNFMEYNDRIQESLHTTAEMKAMGVIPSPAKVFSMGLTLNGGVARRLLNPADVWRRLAEHKPNVQVTLNGIRMLRSRYSSAALESYYAFADNKERVRVDVFYDPLRPNFVYWITPEGVLDELERRVDGQEAWGNASAADIDSYSLQMKAVAQLQRKEKQKKAKLSGRQEGIARDAALHARKIVRKSATTHQDVVRGAEANLHLANRPYDKAASFLPGLAAEALQADVQPAGSASPDSVPAEEKVDGPDAAAASAVQEAGKPGTKLAKARKGTSMASSAGSEASQAPPTLRPSPRPNPDARVVPHQSKTATLFQQLLDDGADSD